MASEMVLDLQDPSEDRNMLESRCFSGFWVSMREREREFRREREKVAEWRSGKDVEIGQTLVLIFVLFLFLCLY